MEKPIEEGNADEIYEECYPLIKLALLRGEAIVDHLIEEPCLIHIYPEKDAEKVVCEKILTFFLDIPNEDMESYVVYSNSREDFSQEWYTVVRKVYWHKKVDQHQIIKNPDRQEEMFLKLWPNVTIKNIAMKQNVIIKEIIEGLDKIIENGIITSEREGALPYRNDIAVTRRFDWGEVRSRWDRSRQNERLEEYIIESLRKLEQIVDGEQSLFYKMVLDYMVKPELFHKLVVGE